MTNPTRATSSGGPVDKSAGVPDAVRHDRRSPLLLSDEAAAYLRMPLSTLYQLRARGEAPRGVRVGRRVHYYKVDLDDWLEARREQP